MAQLHLDLPRENRHRIGRQALHAAHGVLAVVGFTQVAGPSLFRTPTILGSGRTMRRAASYFSTLIFFCQKRQARHNQLDPRRRYQRHQ
jgi:hypothetical protein